jgi:hypothetical protein
MVHAAAARGETRRMNRHDAEQRTELPRTPVFQRTLRAASRAEASAAAIFLCLCLNKMTLQLGQQLLGLRQGQAQGLRRTGGRATASDMHLECLHLLSALLSSTITRQCIRPSPSVNQLTSFKFGDRSRARDRGCHRAKRRLVFTQLNRRPQAAGPDGVPPRSWTVSCLCDAHGAPSISAVSALHKENVL